jgi:hypothetical protein
MYLTRLSQCVKCSTCGRADMIACAGTCQNDAEEDCATTCPAERTFSRDDFKTSSGAQHRRQLLSYGTSAPSVMAEIAESLPAGHLVSSIHLGLVDPKTSSGSSFVSSGTVLDASALHAGLHWPSDSFVADSKAHYLSDGIAGSVMDTRCTMSQTDAHQTSRAAGRRMHADTDSEQQSPDLSTRCYGDANAGCCGAQQCLQVEANDYTRIGVNRQIVTREGEVYTSFSFSFSNARALYGEQLTQFALLLTLDAMAELSVVPNEDPGQLDAISIGCNPLDGFVAWRQRLPCFECADRQPQLSHEHGFLVKVRLLRMACRFGSKTAKRLWLHQTV